MTIVDVQFGDSGATYAYAVQGDPVVGDLVETPANEYRGRGVARIINPRSNYRGAVRTARLLGPPPPETFRDDCAHSLTWERDDLRGSTSRYVRVKFELTCGCRLRTIRPFSGWASTALGWTVGTTTGWGEVWTGEDDDDRAVYYCHAAPGSLRGWGGVHPEVRTG